MTAGTAMAAVRLDPGSVTTGVVVKLGERLADLGAYPGRMGYACWRVPYGTAIGTRVVTTVFA
ncbi:hypothetical protein UFOVP1382_155 [uncultured Caudovirales phage]|uniref:Uncharacterized protein n=1 Tax=uncultured Caudovirales phage TaxID=2100421 RepID=A0A6J5S4I8_9CAUD|nr:hypothetical protein UFOVP1382_155 [uncultured Caudovirales phage]